MTDDVGIGVNGLSGRESRPEVLLGNRDFFFSEQLG